MGRGCLGCFQLEYDTIKPMKHTLLGPSRGNNRPHDIPENLVVRECPLCKAKPQQVVSEFYRSDQRSWQSLGGRQGFKYFCAEHPDQHVGNVWTLMS